MKKYSEFIHESLPLDNFKLSGDLVRDVDKYREINGIPKSDIGMTRAVTLRLSFGEHFTVHTLTDGVIEKIKHTRIENIPKEIPKLMQDSFLIEARHDKLLLPDIQSIGGLLINNTINLVFMTVNGKDYSQTFSKSFDGRKIEELNAIYNNDHHNIPQLIYMKERKDILSFVLIFALMMEAEKTPFNVDVKNNKKHNGRKLKQKEKSGWIEKRIYIDKIVKYKNTGKSDAVLDKNGKYLKETVVHGFLRLQYFGKGMAETKWVYIDDYDSKRWVNAGNNDTKITVDLYDK